MTVASRRFRPSSLVAAATILLGAASGAWAQTGNGLIGECFDNNNFTNRLAVRVDEPAAGGFNFNYGAGTPDPAITVGEDWSVRWRGQIEAPSTETYTFFGTADNTIRLVINNTQVFAAGAAPTGTFAMTAGQRYDIMIEFVELTGNASVRLEWSSPVTTPRADVPKNRLYSPAVVPADPVVSPNGGVTPQSVTITCATPGVQIYYTLNDTDPGLMNPTANAASLLYTVPFNVNTYLRVRTRAYLGGVSSNQITSLHYSPTFAAITPPAGIVQGLYFKEYSNPSGSLLPNFAPLIPRQRGLVPQPTHLVPPLPPRIDGDTNIGYYYQGYINVPTSGMWTLYTRSDDGSRLWIDGNLVVENNFGQGATTRSGQIELVAGYHACSYGFAQGGGGFFMSAEWQGPGGVPAQQLVPVANYFTEPLVASPVIAPNGGAFSTSQVVTLTCATPSSTIYYTIDGSNPDPRQANGSGPSGLTVTLTSGCTLKALAAAPGMNTSAIVRANFTFPPRPITATAAGTPTEVIILFDKPVNETSAALSANFTTTGPTVSASAALARAGVLAAHYKLDDTTGADSSGNGNTATVTNGGVGTAPQFANFVNPPSANSGSVLFGGTTTFTVPDSPSLNVGRGGMTVSAWIRTTNAGATQRIANKWQAGGVDRGWHFDFNGSGALRFRMRDNGNRNFDTATSIGLMVANTWYHVAVVVDKLSQQVRFFINGVQIGAPINASADMDSLTTPALFGIGEIPAALGSKFGGSIDDVRLYKATLTNAEIAALAGGSDRVSSSVRMTTSAMAAGTTFTLTVSNLQDWSGNAIPAAGVTIPFRYFGTGTVSFERFDGITGGAVTDLSRNAVYPSGSSVGSFPTLLESTTNQADNFGGRLRGYIIPPVSGNFQFGLATDDGGKLLLSTDQDPSNKVVISRNNAWAPVRAYTDPDSAQSGSIALVAGQKYYFEAFNKEGGGGDNLAVAVKVFDGTPIPDGTVPIGDPSSPFPASAIAPYVESVVFPQNVPNRTVVAGTNVTLNVPFLGTHSGAVPAPRYQWQLNGVDITGANGPTYTITGATAANSGNYTLIVATAINTLASPVLTLAVSDAPDLVVAPPGGPLAGGTAVTITGTGFVPGLTTVTFGGTAATGIVVQNSTTLTCVAPAGPAGPAAVVVTSQSYLGTDANGFTYYAPPTVTPPLNPTAGPIAGLAGVTITGTNLGATGLTTVAFGGVAATNVVVAANQLSLSCDAPAHAAGAVNVDVTTPGGTTTANNAFTYYDPPTITPPLSPAAGPLGGIANVTINGTNLGATGLTTVSFGGTAATNVVVNGAGTQLTCDAPAHAAGQVNVVVTAPGGVATAVNGFTYYDVPSVAPPLNPTAGPVAGLAGVVINGANLGATGLTTVSFGGTAATNVVVNGAQTQITCDAPAHAAGQVNVTVTTPGGNTTAIGAFTYYAAPAITPPLSPNGGPLGGIAGVLINGASLGATGLTTVSFGGTAATNVVVNGAGTQITCDAPAHAAGQVNVVVTAPGGVATAVNGFTYYNVPAVVGPLSPINGPSQGGTTVTINGTDLGTTGSTTVNFGGSLATNVVVNGAATQLTCTTSGHDAGFVNVTVTTPGGSSNTLVGAYEYIGPWISNISPNGGPVAGGQSVTLSGSGFLAGPVTLTIGGNPALNVVVVNGGTITFTTPAHAVGPVDVVLTVAGNPATVVNGYAYLGTVTITSVVINRGPIGGGQSVVINGSNFASGQTTVTFGGVAATGIVVQPGNNALDCVTPLHTAGVVDVSVTTFAGPATLAGGYTYVPPPTISSVVSNRGSIAGGQTVTITGTNFEAGGETAVTFGGVAATGVAVASATSLTCMTPANAAGAVNVVVSTFTPAQLSGNLTYTYVDPATTVDLNLLMTVDTATPILGADVTFTLTVANSGGVNATGVVITDFLPPGLTFVSSIASAGAYTAASGIWNLGTLNTASNATLTIVATVTSTSAVTNSAEIAGSNEFDLDSTPGNGIAGEDDQASVTVSAGLTITTAGGLMAPATSGAFYSQQIGATGGVPTYTWSLASGTLPFNLDPATGRISGTAPLAAGTYNFTLAVTDSSAPPSSVSRAFSIDVVAPVPATPPTVTTAQAPPAGTIGVAFSHTFTASGGPAPYTWSVVGTLPAGLFLDSTTGRVAGTPTTAGTSNFTIQAANGSGTNGAAVSITINANPVVFVTQAVPDGSVGAPYDTILQVSGGIGPNFTWTLIGPLPPGLSLTGTTRVATITGTPASNGTFNFDLQVTDTSPGGASVTKTFSLVVQVGSVPLAATTTPTPPTATVGQPFSLNLTGIGGTRPYTWTLATGAMPAGLTLSGAAGTITGSPTVSGVFELALRATDSFIPAASVIQSVTINIAPAPTITTPSPLPSAIRNVGYSTALAVSGGAAPFSWSLTGALPAGLSLSQDSGAISGMTGALATATTFDITVTDANGATDVATLTLPVADPAGLMSVLNSLPPALVGVPYSATLLAAGGAPPYTFSIVGTLPPWATFDAATGTIYGTPTGGAVTFQIQVTDGTTTLTSNGLTVNAVLTIVQTSLPGGTVGSGYGTTLTSTGGVGAVQWSLVSGGLPGGLTLDALSGLLSGVPQINQTATFLIRVTDSAGSSAQRQYSVAVGGGGPPPPPPTGGGKKGGGGCGLTGAELLLLWVLRRRARR